MALDALGGRLLSLERRLQGPMQRAFERRYGVETGEKVDLSDLGVSHKEQISYYASPPIALRSALKRVAPAPDDVVVDLGSGKGQALIVAARFPVARVIGVELADELTAIARSNFVRARRKLRCSDVELVTSDATEWPMPDDVSIVHMYCPFVGELFASVVERIFESFDRAPRPLLLLYGYPWEHNWLIRTGRMRTVDVNFARWPARPGWWDSDHVYVTYQVTAPDGSAPTRRVARGGLAWRKAMDHWSSPNETRFVIYPPGGGPPLRSE